VRSDRDLCVKRLRFAAAFGIHCGGTATYTQSPPGSETSVDKYLNFNLEIPKLKSCLGEARETYATSLLRHCAAPEAIETLIRLKIISACQPVALPTPPEFKPLTSIQQQIWSALTSSPLNIRQIAILKIYFQAYTTNEPALSVDETAMRLGKASGIDASKASEYIKGSLRSFGRRLFQTLERIPVKLGSNRLGEGVADEIPILAMFSIQAGPRGEKRHKLTSDGVIAVAAALGLNAAGGTDPDNTASNDPDDIVTVGITRSALAAIFYFQQQKGTSFDEAVKTLASLVF
jgi:hypothetical protein